MPVAPVKMGHWAEYESESGAFGGAKPEYESESGTFGGAKPKYESESGHLPLVEHCANLDIW